MAHRSTRSRSSALLRRIERIATIGGWELDFATHTLTWTDQVYRICEVDPETFQPSLEGTSAFFLPDSRPILDAAIQAAIDTGKPWDLELELTTAKGNRRRVRTLGEPTMRRGSCVRLTGTILDVTEQQSAREAPGASAIRAQLERDQESGTARPIGVQTNVAEPHAAKEQAHAASEWLEMASSAMGVGFFYRDADQERGFWDRRTRAIFGIGDDELPPTTEEIARMVVDEDRVAYARVRQGNDISAQPAEANYRIRRRDGEVRWIRSRRTVLRMGEGQPLRIVGTVVDVTEQVAAQEQRQQAIERMQLALDTGAIATWERNLISGEGRWDPRMFSFYGLPAADIAPTFEQISAAIHPDDRAVFRATWDRISREAGAIEYDVRVMQPDGTVRHIATRARAERRIDGTPWRIVGATTDVTQLRQAQAQSREVLDRLQRATDVSGIGTWERNLRTGEARWDAPLFALYGLRAADGAPTRAEAVAMVHPDDRARVEAAWTRMQQVDHAVEFEYRIVRPDGRIVHLNTRGLAERDADGKPWRIVGATIDVTSKQTTQQALQAALERLQLATTTARIGIWQRDIATGVVTWDARMCEIYGVSGTGRQTTPTEWLRHIHPDDRDRAAGADGERLEQGTAEYRVVLADGSLRVVAESFVVRRSPQGERLSLLGTNLDITDIRSAQQERDLLTERIQLAAESIGLGVWDWDLLADSSVWNEQMYALFGRTREEFTGHIWSDFVHADDVSRARAALAVAIASGSQVDIEFRVLLPDGTVRWIASRGRVQRDVVGTPIRMIGVNWDVTDKRTTEAALRDKETAERASKAKSEFLSRMSHELRTPLNAILGFAQVLELDRKWPLAKTQVERVHRIQKAGWHLLTLINEVLELSRIEAGALSISLKDVPIAGLVQECIELVGATVAARGITVAVRIDPQAPATVYADETRLKQVLLNLLSNAIKYNREQGRIDVTVDRDGNTVRLSVRDSGHGMTEAQLAKIFQPFNRLGLEDGEIEGSGIGLSITRHLVELMGGRIDVATEVGIGSEFSVWLPIDDGMPKDAEPARLAGAAADAPTLTATVLYVEDNRLNREVLREVLGLRPGIRLLEAESGAAGLALAAAERPDLALIDLHLPDMNGVELLQRLRARLDYELPCVLLSASALPGESERALQAGFRDYWTKPIAAAPFLLSLDRTLAQLRSQVRI